VAAANYEVRRFGVHSAMATATALRLCPQAIVLPVRMQHYADVSTDIRAILERYTPLVEPLALDEAFLDVTGSESLFGPADVIGRRIKEDIHREVQLVASVGVAPNKFLAKVASDIEKPDGFVVVRPGAVQQFLDPLPVGRLWGVGRVTGATFQRLGVETIGQLRQLPASTLEELFGRTGMQLWRLAQGIDERQVVPDREAKMISHETTFPHDIADMATLRAALVELTEQVGRRLRRNGLNGRTVHLKVRSADFATISRAVTLSRPTDVTQELWQAASELLTQRVPRENLPVRLLGVGVSGLQCGTSPQQQLFDREEHRRQGRLDAAADTIRDRFGAAAIQRASRLAQGDREA
jgi:DNA polymerase-4